MSLHAVFGCRNYLSSVAFINTFTSTDCGSDDSVLELGKYEGQSLMKTNNIRVFVKTHEMTTSTKSQTLRHPVSHNDFDDTPNAGINRS